MIPTSKRTQQQEQYFTAVCQHCTHHYTLGVTGTVMGCDKCLHITRNPLDHTIIDDPCNNDDGLTTDVYDRYA